MDLLTVLIGGYFFSSLINKEEQGFCDYDDYDDYDDFDDCEDFDDFDDFEE